MSRLSNRDPGYQSPGRRSISDPASPLVDPSVVKLHPLEKPSTFSELRNLLEKRKWVSRFLTRGGEGRVYLITKQIDKTVSMQYIIKHFTGSEDNDAVAQKERVNQQLIVDVSKQNKDMLPLSCIRFVDLGFSESIDGIQIPSDCVIMDYYVSPEWSPKEGVSSSKSSTKPSTTITRNDFIQNYIPQFKEFIKCFQLFHKYGLYHGDIKLGNFIFSARNAILPGTRYYGILTHLNFKEKITPLQTQHTAGTLTPAGIQMLAVYENILTTMDAKQNDFEFSDVTLDTVNDTLTLYDTPPINARALNNNLKKIIDIIQRLLSRLPKQILLIDYGSLQYKPHFVPGGELIPDINVVTPGYMSPMESYAIGMEADLTIDERGIILTCNDNWQIILMLYRIFFGVELSGTGMVAHIKMSKALVEYHKGRSHLLDTFNDTSAEQRSFIDKYVFPEEVFNHEATASNPRHTMDDKVVLVEYTTRYNTWWDQTIETVITHFVAKGALRRKKTKKTKKTKKRTLDVRDGGVLRSKKNTKRKFTKQSSKKRNTKNKKHRKKTSKNNKHTNKPSKNRKKTSTKRKP